MPAVVFAIYWEKNITCCLFVHKYGINIRKKKSLESTKLAFISDSRPLGQQIGKTERILTQHQHNTTKNITQREREREYT